MKPVRMIATGRKRAVCLVMHNSSAPNCTGLVSKPALNRAELAKYPQTWCSSARANAENQRSGRAAERQREHAARLGAAVRLSEAAADAWQAPRLRVRRGGCVA